MNAVSPIDKLNVVKRLQRTLRDNPNDVNALLELAALQGTFQDPNLELQRKLLNKILTLDPVNSTAREMLLQMDRAAITGEALQPPASTRSMAERVEKPVVFRYSIIHQILVYPLLLLSILFMFQALGDWGAFSFFAGFFLLFSIPIWFFSAVVRVSSSGIQVSRLFGLHRREVKWLEIDTIKPAFMGVGMKIAATGGTSVTVSSQMHGYRTIVELMQRIRPDLFDAANGKVFRKSFFAKYGMFFFLVPCTPMALGGILVPPFLPGILCTVVIMFLWRTALNTVHLLTVNENKLSAQSFRRKQELTAQQINDIGIITLRTRRGVAKHFVQIELLDGNAFRLSGFPEGNEVMCGILRNWWESCN
jgi:hypothetical protein